MDHKRAELAKQQAEHIEKEIESLRSGHRDLYECRYREFFQHAKQISELFNEARAVPHLERQRLWELFSSLCENVRRDEKRDKESCASESRVKRGPIESNIREAYSWGKAARSISELAPPDEPKAVDGREGVADKDKPAITLPAIVEKPVVTGESEVRRS